MGCSALPSWFLPGPLLWIVFPEGVVWLSYVSYRKPVHLFLLDLSMFGLCFLFKQIPVCWQSQFFSRKVKPQFWTGLGWLAQGSEKATSEICHLCLFIVVALLSPPVILVLPGGPHGLHYSSSPCPQFSQCFPISQKSRRFVLRAVALGGLARERTVYDILLWNYS